jgi:hypothetical protein
MRVVLWRSAAWAALLLGLANNPLLAEAPKGTSPGTRETGKKETGKKEIGNKETSAKEHLTKETNKEDSSAATSKTSTVRPVTSTARQTTGRERSESVPENTNSTNTNTEKSNTKEETPLSLLQHSQRLVSGTQYKFDGHKASAQKAIHKAILLLDPPKPAAAGSGNHPTEGQNQSSHVAHASSNASGGPAVYQTLGEAEAKLRNAIDLLNKAHGKLGTENGDATKEVANAVTELTDALKYKD